MTRLASRTRFAAQGRLETGARDSRFINSTKTPRAELLQQRVLARGIVLGTSDRITRRRGRGWLGIGERGGGPS